MRNYNINIIISLRGLAALGVVLFHFVYSTTDFVEDKNIRFVFGLGQLGVNLFFLISGIVIPLFMIKTDYSYLMFRSFWLRRLVRVEPSYLVAILLGGIFLSIRGHFREVNITPQAFDYFLHLGYLVPFFDGSSWINTVFWTLAVEFQYYLLLSLCFPLLAGKSLVRLVAIPIILSLRLISNDHSLVFYWMPVFLVGIIYALKITNRISVREFSAWCLLLGTFLLYDNQESFLVLVLALPIIHFFPNVKIPGLHWIGGISYSLYLFHQLSGGALINVLSRYTESPLSKVCLVLLGITIALSFALLMFLLVEKPAHKSAQKIKLKSS